MKRVRILDEVTRGVDLEFIPNSNFFNLSQSGSKAGFQTYVRLLFLTDGLT